MLDRRKENQHGPRNQYIVYMTYVVQVSRRFHNHRVISTGLQAGNLATLPLPSSGSTTRQSSKLNRYWPTLGQRRKLYGAIFVSLALPSGGQNECCWTHRHMIYITHDVRGVSYVSRVGTT